jgi:spore germination protein KC
LCLLLALCGLLFSQAGCWDKKELNELAIVIGAGIDKTADGQFRLTAQVIKPTSAKNGSQGIGESGGGGGGGADFPTWSLSAEGKSVMEAIAQLNKISPRRLFWPHTLILVFGEKLAREGVLPAITWFERERYSRTGTYVAITKGKAEDLFNHKMQLGALPSKAMSDMIETANLRQISSRKLTLREFTDILSTSGIDPALDMIVPKVIRGKVESYQLAGIGLFKEDKLIDIVNGPETMGISLVRDGMINTIIQAPCPDKKQGNLVFKITNYQRKTKLSISGKQVNYDVNLLIDGDLGDQTCTMDLLDPDKKSKTEQSINSEIKNKIIKLFTRSAALNTDVYGIGRQLHRQHPGEWHSLEKGWESRLKKISFDAHVKTNIRRSDLTSNPSIRKKR